MSQPEVMTVAAAARRLRVGVRTAYTAVRQEQIPHLHIASRVVIPVAAFERWLAEGSQRKENDQ